MSAKVIMIQGTMSNSGKTFLTAGLCRVFMQDGYKTAPFKSQNMALNSYITEEGLEIGRAQAMQAEAANIKPTIAMNPILLKPTSVMGSQVIVNGEVYGNLSASEYFKRKTEFIPDILKAYKELSEDYDIIVIEGAGSPAEINLKSQDIVNMGMAKMVNAPVLLIADIDRGGVFASLYGTLKLLEQEEQDRVCGMIINKFRGDKEILKSGLSMLEELTNKPVLGLIPMEEIELDDEDSLAERLNQKAMKKSGKDVAVIRLPHLSNFTDFLALEWYSGISLRYVEKKEELGKPDYILLPGSKNTMADLKWLRERGLEGAILRLRNQTSIFGICGGFQMMGAELFDPDGVEFGGIMRGMGLLPIRTIFRGQKTRTQTEARLSEWTKKAIYPEQIQEQQENENQAKEAQGCKNNDFCVVSGYEIHMGTTEYQEGARPFSILMDGRADGAISEDGKAAGTYLHGIFDNEFFVKNYFQAKEQMDVGDFRKFKETQYDKLADLIRKSLDMDAIYQILFPEKTKDKKQEEKIIGENTKDKKQEEREIDKKAEGTEDRAQGRIHVYCGDGKGKTTAAMGLALRAAGAGKKVLIYQFMKDNKTSERNSLTSVDKIHWVEGLQQVKFSWQMTEEEKEEILFVNNKKLLELFEQASSYDLLILDESIYAVAAKLLEEKLLLKCLKEKSQQLEVVLTGQNPSQNLLKIANYITEMKKIRHPYDTGEKAKKGIEY